MANIWEDMLRRGMVTVGRVGAKALARAVDSALQDVGKAAKDIDVQIKNARNKLEDIIEAQAYSVEEDPKKEDDDDGRQDYNETD